MLLSLKSVFRRFAVRPIFFNADCSGRALKLWHNLADISDYLSSLPEAARAEKKADLFNALAQDHDWPVAGADNKIQLWLSGMFDSAHQIYPNTYFVKHMQFLRRQKLDDAVPPANALDFALDHHADLSYILRKARGLN